MKSEPIGGARRKTPMIQNEDNNNESESNARKSERCGRFHRKDDSVDSCSARFSDTSSLHSHRYSMISISSNVSSEGSSCYLASVSSSADDAKPLAGFKPCSTKCPPGLTSSFSFSDDCDSAPEARGRPAKVRVKSLRKDHPEQRSRIGTETSQETASFDIPTCLYKSSFEDDSSAFQKDEIKSQQIQAEKVAEKKKAKKKVTPSVDIDSSDAETGSGGALTHHRYYHVFREGELDSLIREHVDSLHIINSYYDHANWCIIAEKVNVWSL